MIETRERKGTDSLKWGIYGEDVIPLWVADMDFVSPPVVIEALKNRVEHGIFGYGSDSDSLKNLIIARMHTLHDWSIAREDIVFLPGIVSALNLVCQAVTKPGDSILMHNPIYPPFLSAPANAGCSTIINEVKPDEKGQYSVDLDSFNDSIHSDTTCFLLCNPHNPVGRVYTRKELAVMAEICIRHDLIICSDEIHCDLVYTGNKHIPIASLSNEISTRTVTLIAPSKTFNIPGLACSILICTNPELRKRIEKNRRGLLGGVNVLGMTAAEAAYLHGDSWLKDMLNILEGNRDFLYDFIAKNIPLMKMIKPQATYLAWLDCHELGLPVPPKQFFHEQAKVALSEGAEFGDCGKGFARLNFACSRATLIKALDQMAEAVNSRK